MDCGGHHSEYYVMSVSIGGLYSEYYVRSASIQPLATLRQVCSVGFDRHCICGGGKSRGRIVAHEECPSFYLRLGEGAGLVCLG
ncbi:hypothetical protein ACLOJK_006736 [Asimina triloba]